MADVFLKIVNMSISASWLVLAVLGFRLVFKKAPKWIHVLLWGIVAVRLLCPFSIESALSLIPSAETISPEIMMSPEPAIHTGVPAINSVVNPIITETFAPEPVASANPLQILIPVLAMIWGIGVALLLAYTAISYWRLHRKVRAAVLLCDNIFQSEVVSSPFVLGIIKPKIYLPFKMDGQNLEHVVSHEQAHIRRRDHWWKPLGFLLLTIHWFNPLMWLAYVLLCRDIELACDEKVVKELGRDQRADYSQALLACSVNRRMIAACPLAFGEVGVKERVKTVLNYKKPAFWVMVVSVVACAVVAVCFLTNPIDAIEGYYHIEGFGIYNDSEYYVVVNDGVELECTKEQYEQVESLVERFRTGEMEDAPIYVTYKQFLISYKRGTVIELKLPTEFTPSAQGIWERKNTSDPVEMLAYLCQSELWDSRIEEKPQISVPGNFGPHAYFSNPPEDADALDIAVAKRAFLLMRLYPEEVFYVTWSYPDESGEQVRREFHADEMSVILSLSSHSQNYEIPASVEDVDRLIQFLTIDGKPFLRHATEGNDFSLLLEAQENAVWFTPEDIHDVEYMELVWHDGQRFTPLTGEGYEYIQNRFSSAKEIGATGCPYHSVLYIHRSDGVVGKVLPAEDSCDVFQSGGKFYQFGDRANPPYYDSNEAFYKHFGTSIEELPHYQTSIGNNAVKIEELLEVFKKSNDEDETVIVTDCVIANDGAYGLEGVVQYTDESGVPWKLAFIRDGIAYPVGLAYTEEYSVVSGLTYLGNGAVQVYIENSNSGKAEVCKMEYFYDEEKNHTKFRATTEDYDPQEGNDQESELDQYYLTIGADDVASIELTMPNSSGGFQNADGSLLKKGEKIWLENLDGYVDLRGLKIMALNRSGEIIWSASIPDRDENRGFTHLTQDGWTITNIK